MKTLVMALGMFLVFTTPSCLWADGPSNHGFLVKAVLTDGRVMQGYLVWDFCGWGADDHIDFGDCRYGSNGNQPRPGLPEYAKDFCRSTTVLNCQEDDDDAGYKKAFKIWTDYFNLRAEHQFEGLTREANDKLPFVDLTFLGSPINSRVVSSDPSKTVLAGAVKHIEVDPSGDFVDLCALPEMDLGSADRLADRLKKEKPTHLLEVGGNSTTVSYAPLDQFRKLVEYEVMRGGLTGDDLGCSSLEIDVDGHKIKGTVGGKMDPEIGVGIPMSPDWNLWLQDLADRYNKASKTDRWKRSKILETQLGPADSYWQHGFFSFDEGGCCD
ncbi:MAG TPA: hypothetical protein VK914_02020 [bacterium]|jgi:hypothetical protein|nr:hypothetical protein [bacterium]